MPNFFSFLGGKIAKHKEYTLPKIRYFVYLVPVPILKETVHTT